MTHIQRSRKESKITDFLIELQSAYVYTSQKSFLTDFGAIVTENPYNRSFQDELFCNGHLFLSSKQVLYKDIILYY